MDFNAPISVPTLPDMPDADSILGPGVTDFEDFGTYTACIEKQTVFTAKTLKLASVTLTASLQIRTIRGILGPMLGLDQSSIKIPDIGELNLDMSISKITAPKVNKLPQCLADSITGKVSTAGANGMKDILDPFNTGIGALNSLTSEASGLLNSAAKSFTDNVNNGIHQVNKMIEKTMGNIIAPGDKVLFAALDKFQKFVDDTSYVETYKDWKDIYNCLKKNCQALEEFLVNDDFLYYDKEHKKFIMPIELSSGRLRIAKFFENLTREQLKEANVIEKRYYKYLTDKKEVLRNAAAKARGKGVAEDKNPFASVSNSLIDDGKNIVNTLF